VNKDVVVVGLLENQNEFLNLFDKIFLLQCREKTFFERIDNRTTNGFGKDYSEKEHILSFYKKFEEDLIKKGAIPINVEESLESVVSNIISKI
jgi:thymidylate kinase